MQQARNNSKRGNQTNPKDIGDASPLLTFCVVEAVGPITKHHSKSIEFSFHDRRALGSIITSANASEVGSGTKVIKTRRHPNDCSTESAFLVAYPSNSTIALRTLHLLSHDLIGKSKNGLVVPVEEAMIVTPAQKEAARQSAKSFQQTIKANMRSFCDSSVLREARITAGQFFGSTAPLSSLSPLKFSIKSTTSFTKLMSTFALAPEHQHLLLNYSSSLPSVGTRGTVLCLTCLE